MTVRERIKLEKKGNISKKPISKYLIEKITNTCCEENKLNNVRMCDFEDCRLFETKHCDMWKYWLNDEKYIEDNIKDLL